MLPFLPQGQLSQESIGTVVASAPAGLGQGGGTRGTVQQHVSPRLGHFLGSQRAALPRGWAPTATHKPLQTPLWAGLGLVGWGQFTEQITEPGCEPAVSKSLCPLRGTGNSVSMGGSTDLGDEPLGRQEETSLLAQQPSFQHVSCSRQGWRAGSSSQAEKFLCIQSFYSIKISGS